MDEGECEEGRGKKKKEKGGGRKKKNKHGSIFRFPFTGTHRTCPFRTRLANVPHCARRTLLAVCVAPSRCRTTSAFRRRLHNCMSTYSHAQTKKREEEETQQNKHKTKKKKHNFQADCRTVVKTEGREQQKKESGGSSVLE